MAKSTEFSVKDAAIKIVEMESPDEILAFIEGDNRKGVIAAADERLKELGHEGLKEGQVDKITDNTKDFKGPGVEGKKEKEHVTIEDVIKTLRQKGEKI